MGHGERDVVIGMIIASPQMPDDLETWTDYQKDDEIVSSHMGGLLAG